MESKTQYFKKLHARSIALCGLILGFSNRRLWVSGKLHLNIEKKMYYKIKKIYIIVTEQKSDIRDMSR